MLIIFITSKRDSISSSYQFPLFMTLPSIPTTTNLLPLWIYNFEGFCLWEIIWYLKWHAWLLSLNRIGWVIFHHIDIPQRVYPFVCGWLFVLFPLWSVSNTATRIIYMQVLYKSTFPILSGMFLRVKLFLALFMSLFVHVSMGRIKYLLYEVVVKVQ